LVLGNLGIAGKTIAYFKAVEKLEEDLGNTKSILSNINMIVENPDFAELIK
jgi:hypothetical protein